MNKCALVKLLLKMFKRAVQLKPDYVDAQAKLLESHGK
jgi:hypothetical protein